jgi:hypothetical protein
MLPEVARHRDDATREVLLESRQAVAPQVVPDGGHGIGVFLRTHEAVDLSVRPPEQRVEEERPQKAGRAGQEDAAGVAQ